MIEHEILEATVVNTMPSQGSNFKLRGGRRGEVGFARGERAFGFDAGGEVAGTDFFFEKVVKAGEFRVGSSIMHETEKGLPYVHEEGHFSGVLEKTSRRYGVDGGERKGDHIAFAKRGNQTLI